MYMTNILFRRRKLGNGSCRGIQAVSTTGLTMHRNDSPLPTGLNYVFRWGCTSSIPERDGVVVVNKASAIHWCSNKKQGRLDMQAAGVSVPETWVASAFYADAVRGLAPAGEYVLRPQTHAQGKELYSGNTAEIRDVIAYRNLHGGYVSRLINKVAEYRVMVVQNRAAWVAKKTPGNPDDVAWNVARGGRFDNVRWGDWPMAVIKEALAAAKVSGCDFCGVDVMVDAAGKAYVLEVNSAPSQTSEYRQACVAKAFDHIVTNGKEPLADPSRLRGWKDAIHPAVWSSSNA
jgi:glutathione synthase/RimK-type ligase-like ATP-grasp enzyme